MDQKGKLRFLVSDIQMFADKEQPSPYDEAIEDPDQVSESEVKENADEPKEEEPKEQGQTPAEEGKDENPKQSRSQNAEFARKRREAEKAAKEKAEKENQERLRQEFVKGQIKGIGGKNPYTGEDIVDEEDFHEYEVMKALDDKGEDPIKGAYKVLREERMNRKKEEQADAELAEQARKEQQQSIDVARKNIEEFGKSHPDVKFGELWKSNEKFHGLIVHGYTPNEAYDLLGLGEGDATGRESTPSTTPGGAKHEKSTLDMSDEEFLTMRHEKYGY